jgi:hypothetical protein
LGSQRRVLVSRGSSAVVIIHMKNGSVRRKNAMTGGTYTNTTISLQIDICSMRPHPFSSRRLHNSLSKVGNDDVVNYDSP